ncbi:MAG: hypothetical protein EXS16_13520 [Gemmataceae bacterium]|nr:hypothetical protein [Gemmataceae bacterium]
MRFLVTCDSPFSLEDLTVRIRATSNFRFNWQFFQFSGFDPRSPDGVRKMLEEIIAVPDLHRFLKDSFKSHYHPAFKISPLHQHAKVVAASGVFEDILARAASDRLGAYSPNLRPADAREIEEIGQLFGQLDPYFPFELQAGNTPGCVGCTYSHIFTDWFDCVAWDWTLIATWPIWELMWLGCLTDTD